MRSAKALIVVGALILIATLCSMAAVGCATLPPNATTQQIAAYDQQVAQDYQAYITSVKAATTTFSSGFLKSQAAWNEADLARQIAADLLPPLPAADDQSLLTQKQQAEAAWAKLNPSASSAS